MNNWLLLRPMLLLQVCPAPRYSPRPSIRPARNTMPLLNVFRPERPKVISSTASAYTCEYRDFSLLYCAVLLIRCQVESKRNPLKLPSAPPLLPLFPS